ncbi:MAG: MFS transporter [Verrucomicrobia bacterium]|jgi:acyl-[acyl-carrier-protein]-phospholipid O-acyltransferase / long-chain-fatty-acid--[acyl-carrier-protein] ligase|nr:MFS transporter [Verrucomicrobiota bacterium]MBT7067332.1 MFS transporter [Verrucomicrobiota bacterium]MBT7699517.1 MFS transporter [Verrucomicrobiota bacterium]
MGEDNRTTRSSFGWLNATQFLGALNDNVFRFLLVYLVIALHGTESAAKAGVIGMVLLAMPFLLFSAAAGILADKVSKRNIVVVAKGVEVVAMLAGCLAFYFRLEWVLFGIMFFMATQSAFFGPAKYGLIPELVPRERLSKSNAWLQAMTNLAILLGTVLVPLLSRATHDNYFHASLVCVGIAILGLLVSLPIRHTPAAGVSRRASLFFLKDIQHTLASIRHDRYLVLAVLASAYFTLLGAFMQINLIPYALEELGLSKEAGTYLFLLVAVGIGLGAMLAGQLSGRNVELGIVPLGALGLTLGAMLLGFGSLGLVSVCMVVLLMGLSAGLFVVPLNAWIQSRAPRERLGEVLAASSFLSWVGVLLAAGLVHLLANVAGAAPRHGFALMGGLTLFLTIATLWVLPDFLVRFLALVLTRSCYRLRMIGLENVPLDGSALLVCNHVSWADAVLLMATQQRRIRFLANRSIFQRRFWGPMMRLMGVIPIAMNDGPKQLVTSLQNARAALDEGYLVCIFAEGALTRSGNLLSFKQGFQHIVKGTSHPIIPVYLGGAWGSIFSYAHGLPHLQWPLSFPYPVTILFGQPLLPTADTTEVREAVMNLSCDYFNSRKEQRRPLAAEFVRTARRNWSRPAMADTTGRNLTFGQSLCGAIALAARLKKVTTGQTHVGVLLPPSVAGALANLALSALGKIPVNLNYTTSPAAFASAIAQCGIQTVVTSRIFLERLDGMPAPPGAIYMEDVFARLDGAEKRRAWLTARLAPHWRIVKQRKLCGDTPATVIFSSGSSGEPKGVMLSHHNVLSNIESLRIVFQPGPEDKACGVLPFFHSFGFMATLWLPLLSGFAAVYHTNPLDGTRVAEVVREHRATLLFATPTFLLAYIRRAKREDFASLRLVVTGAEKLKPRVAEAFKEKFDIMPREGYGATELAPVATINVPDVRRNGLRQVGTKLGSVGHPVPGVVIRIVDPDTREPLPIGTTGLMLVKGPNVMLGYLGMPHKTAEVLKDGWYNTGDIASMDRDGFVTITDRLSRFSKIGGEMVPHIGVEEALQQALNKTAQVLVVTSVPDERKGERLVVLYTDEAGNAETVQRAIAECDIPNLWRPGAAFCFLIEALPMLGSGKLDLQALTSLARERTVH